jgi:hypothetical protein
MFIVKICRKFLHFTAETKMHPEQVFDSLGKFISGTQNALDESLSALFNIRLCVLATQSVSPDHEFGQRLYRKVN